MLIDEFRELEKSVKDFDHRSFDLTVLSDAELNEIESSRLPLYHLRDLAYKERLRRCEIREKERAKEQARLKARYGYHFPDKETLNGWDYISVKHFEKGIIEGTFTFDKETAMEIIHKLIPTISDEEIEEYRKEAMEEEKSRASEKKVSDQTNEERENQIILNAAPKG